VISPADHYAKQLLGSGADRWLFARGIWSQSIFGWKLGYVGKALKGDEAFVGCLTIPYYDGLGRERPEAMRFRPLYVNPRAKYLNRSGAPHHLFGLMYTDYPKVYVAEGEIDAITLWQTGRKAVGVAGADAWRKPWRWLFRNCEEVIVVFDNDMEKDRPDGRKVNAGQSGAGQVYRALESLGLHVRNVKLPQGHDVNSLYIADRKKLEGVLG